LYNYLVLPNNIIFMTICLENCNKYVAGIKVNDKIVLKSQKITQIWTIGKHC